MIKLLSHKEIKELQKSGKARRNQGLFVIEGIRLFRETPPESLYQVCVSENFPAENPGVLDGIRYEALPENKFRSLCQTQNPQGILAVVRQKKWQMERVLEVPSPRVLILENLQDPGNMGTIFRTAEAAGFHAIFMTGDCVDLYNPKTVRSTMGAIYRMPHREGDTIQEIADFLKERKITIYAASLRARKSYLEMDYTGGTAFMIGNEGNGLTPSAEKLADELLYIPMAGRTESLNAAMAAGILMYETARQMLTKNL